MEGETTMLAKIRRGYRKTCPLQEGLSGERRREEERS
jgi:hypothetical protein